MLIKLTLYWFLVISATEILLVWAALRAGAEAVTHGA
jgi:hypothetical protein